MQSDNQLTIITNPRRVVGQYQITLKREGKTVFYREEDYYDLDDRWLTIYKMVGGQLSPAKGPIKYRFDISDCEIITKECEFTSIEWRAQIPAPVD